MSPIQDYQCGRFPEALGWWAAQLDAGRSWGDIEAEIIACCEGRADLLTQLLIAAETSRAFSTGPGQCRARPAPPPLPFGTSTSGRYLRVTSCGRCGR